MRTWLASARARMATVTEVFRSPDLRRLQIAWGGYHAGEWAQLVALSVYAYDEGGATYVGLLGLVRMVPAAIALPFGAMATDRFPRQRVLVACYALRAVALAATAAVLALDASIGIVFVLAALAAVFSAPVPPAHWSLVPVLARTPHELVAANVSSSTLEGLASLAGPVAAGLLLALSGPEVVVALSAALYVWCTYLSARVAPEADPTRGARRVEKGELSIALAGFRTLAQQPASQLIVGLFSAQTFVRGLLNVLIVSASLVLLDLGEAGVGFLSAAFGAGMLVGAFAAVSLVRRRRLADPFTLGLVLWGTPIALIGVWPEAAWALLCLGLVGFGNAVLDVSGYTLLQRTVDDRVLGRVFAAFEILVLLTIALGSIIVPVLIEALGLRGTLIAAGALLPALALLFRPRLRQIDESSDVPVHELGLLESVPLFAPLPITSLEKLASRLQPVAVDAGTRVINQGDAGDLFYLIDEGEAAVIHDGRRVAVLESGDFFGEIALLNDSPRVASVSALTDLKLLALDRETFVSAVAGHLRSEERAEDVVGKRLAELGSAH